MPVSSATRSRVDNAVDGRDTRVGGEPAELRSAVEVSDATVNPVGRWQSRASLAGGLRASGDEAAASATADEARRILVAFAATLAPSRAETLLASPRAGEVLEADR